MKTRLVNGPLETLELHVENDSGSTMPLNAYFQGPVFAAALISLLLEAREHITCKPWDDATMLHARISIALGLEVEYERLVKGMVIRS